MIVLFNQRTITQFRQVRKIVSPWTIAPTINGTAGIVLVPGTNEVSERAWEGYEGIEVNPQNPSQKRKVKVKGLKEHPEIKDALENGDLEVIGSEDGSKIKTVAVGTSGQQLPQSLEGIKVKDAIKIITGTANEEAIKRWQATEDRATVVDALTDQLKKLEKLSNDETPNSTDTN